MVYNSSRCKMKRCVFFVIGVIIALVFASVCSNDIIITQSKVHEFTINFSNVANKQTVTEGYAELKGVVSSSDAILVYCYFGNASGEDIWMPLPTTVDATSYEYAYTDSGIFIFNADAGEGNVWTTDFSLKYRVIQIPKTVVASKSMEELKAADYNTVVKELELYEAPVLRK